MYHSISSAISFFQVQILQSTR